MANKHKHQKSYDRFLALRHELLNCPAYRSLSVGARALFIEVYKRHNGHNNGFITFSEREAAEALGMSDRKAIRRYFGELIEREFLRRRVKGGFSNKTRIASHWQITDLDWGGQKTTRPFLLWRPAEYSRGSGPPQNGLDFSPAGLIRDHDGWGDGSEIPSSPPIN